MTENCVHTEHVQTKTPTIGGYLSAIAEIRLSCTFLPDGAYHWLTELMRLPDEYELRPEDARVINGLYRAFRSNIVFVEVEDVQL